MKRFQIQKKLLFSNDNIFAWISNQFSGRLTKYSVPDLHVDNHPSNDLRTTMNMFCAVALFCCWLSLPSVSRGWVHASMHAYTQQSYFNLYLTNAGLCLKQINSEDETDKQHYHARRCGGCIPLPIVRSQTPWSPTWQAPSNRPNIWMQWKFHQLKETTFHGLNPPLMKESPDSSIVKPHTKQNVLKPTESS